MSDTTAAVHDFLRDLKDISSDSVAEPVIRSLLTRACNRLSMLCRNFLVRSYPRLSQPPLNLEVEELLGAIVERLIKALRNVRPETPRQFFALANRHIRWELNDLARRLDERSSLQMVVDVPTQDQSDSCLTLNARRILDAIEDLPDKEREAFELHRIQGLTLGEAAEVAGVSVKTIQRRTKSALLKLTQQLADLDRGPRKSGAPKSELGTQETERAGEGD